MLVNCYIITQEIAAKALIGNLVRLNFKIIPSDCSNDNQTRVLIDGVDVTEFVKHGALGLDPVEFFSQPALMGAGALLIGRCECGFVGYDDVVVTVSRSLTKVEWRYNFPEEKKYTFYRSEYELAINEAASDFSWESLERTAERLVSRLDFTYLEKKGMSFKWASARIKNDRIILCFDVASAEHLIEYPGITNHRSMLSKLCK